MFKIRYRSIVAAAVLLVTPPMVFGQWQHLGDLNSFDLDGPVLTLKCGEAVVRVEAFTDHIVRVRLAPKGKFGRDFSWAVLDLSPKGRIQEASEDEKQITFSTGAVSIMVHRSPCRIEMRDKDGHTLVADDRERGMAWQTGSSPGGVRVWQSLHDWVSIYGLGEKTGPLNKRGRQWTMWNTDAYGYGPTRDPIYKSIPFFMAVRDGRFHGVFFDNPWRSSFDVGHSEHNVLSFGAEGGELNYYVIAGPNPKDVIRRYTDLTGRIEMPPLWALGYHQCRYSYYPESRVREIATTFREKRIPCDVIYFDIDYMDGYRCFTWDKRWFPNPKKLIDDLHAINMRTVAIIDPAIAHEPGFFVYDEGTKKDVWVKKPDGETYVGRVWPGKAVFPDYTDPKVREWWANLYPPFLAACGIDGIWNDMNEPADFDGPNHSVPLDLRHHNEGENAPHLACHNIYGMQMVRATLEGLKRARPDKRPFAITRATYAGGQRYSATWTGDNTSNWEHLRMSIPMVLNMGVSGIPIVGPDIGGFAGGATPELYARWIQLGSLFPFARTHTAWGNPDQEPWSYGPEVEQIARESIERRYALMPYLYTLFEEAAQTGLPVMRPIWMEFPWEGGFLDRAFMLGSNLLVVPIIHPEARDFDHWLPPGAWFDVETNLLHQNGEPVHIDVDAHTLPMFVRAGAIIPKQSVVQSTADTPDEPLILDVWPFGESTGTLYEDDGESLAYQRGEFRRTQFRCVADDKSIEFVIAKPEGTYVPPKRSPLVRLRGLRDPIESVTVDGKRASEGRQCADPGAPSPGDFFYDAESGAWLIRMLPDDGASQTLRVTLGPSRGHESGPVRFDFQDIERDIVRYNDFMTPEPVGHGVRLSVHSVWDPHFYLRRMNLDAEKLPMLRMRVLTEHTSKVGVHFSTLEGGAKAERHYVAFDVTPDGAMHDYAIDLAKASEGRWRGTVYSVRVDFEDNVRAAEVIYLESLSFDAR